MFVTWGKKRSKPSISCAAASLVKTYPARVRARVLLEVARDSGMNTLGFSENSSHDSVSSKTSPAAPIDGLTKSWPGWKSSATKRYRSLCQRLMSELRTYENASSWSGALLPTATATANQLSPSMAKWPDCRRLQEFAGLLPTPRARDWKGPAGHARNSASVPDAVGAKTSRCLNPRFVEWMMGFPSGHAEPEKKS